MQTEKTKIKLFHANREDSDQAGQPDLSLHCLQTFVKQ